MSALDRSRGGRGVLGALAGLKSGKITPAEDVAFLEATLNLESALWQLDAARTVYAAALERHHATRDAWAKNASEKSLRNRAQLLARGGGDERDILAALIAGTDRVVECPTIDPSTGEITAVVIDGDTATGALIIDGWGLDAAATARLEQRVAKRLGGGK